MDSILGRFTYERDAGRLAVHLATEYFFGEAVMEDSTPMGLGGCSKLNPAKMDKIRALVMAKFGRKRSEEDKILLWSRCKTAIGQKCKSFRNRKKGL